MSTDRSRTAPLYCWGENQSGPSTSTFHTVSPRVQPSLRNCANPFLQQNVQHSHQSGPSRTRWISTGQFQPYGMSRTRQNEYRNAGAGQSTQTLPPVPYVSQSMSQPPGGISETTANAEKNQTPTEEDKVPVSSFYCSRVPHVTEWPFGVSRLSGPDAPAAKDHLALTACECNRMRANCATGCSGGRGSKNPRALRGLWKVSTCTVLRNAYLTWPVVISCGRAHSHNPAAGKPRTLPRRGTSRTGRSRFEKGR